MKVLLASAERFSGCIIESLNKRGHEVVGVVSPFKGVFGQQVDRGWRFWVNKARGWDILEVCKKQDIPRRVGMNLGDGAMTAFIRNRAPDLLLLFGWPTLVAPATTELFPLGAMNIHPSLLPRLRGADPLFDIIDKRESSFGLTFHKVVEELDAGPVFLQVPLSYSSDETYDELYFRVLERIHLWLPRALVAMNAKPEGEPQQGEPTRVRSFKQKMRLLNLSKPFADIRRRALACYSHHPMAFSNGKHLMTMIDCVKGRPGLGPEKKHGEVVKVHFFSMTVAQGDGFLRIRGIRFWRKPRWMTPLLLPFLCRPGQMLNSREETQEMIRHRERL